jgi:hypothetical protein
MLKNLNLPFLFVLLSLLFVVACGDDDEDPIIENPELTLFDDGDVDESVVSPGDTLRVSIEAFAGTGELNSLTFLENGERLPNFADRLFINGASAPSNVLLLDSNSRQEFGTEIMLLAAEDAGNYDVEIVVADEDDNSANVSFSYFVSDVNILEGVLLNSGGPAGTGGLDLDTGEGTGSDDPESEIRDQGIDLEAEADSLNWIQRIAPITANDVELAALSSEFDFEAVATRAEVAESFDEAATVDESDVVQIGDVFAVRRGTNHYLLLVTDVNVTPDDNTDSYTFTIKQGQ